MATHKTVSFATLETMRNACEVAKGVSTWWSTDDIQFLLDIITEKDAELATWRIAGDRYKEILNHAQS